MVNKLKLYRVNMKYIRDLHNVDDNVMSVSPQTGKDERPFIGVIVLVNGKNYCIPLTSGNKEKFKNKKNSIDFIKIPDEGLKNENGAFVTIGGINLNNMIPVDYSVIEAIDIKYRESDTKKQVMEKSRLTKELDWCQRNASLILSRANRVYDLRTNYPEKNISLTRRCCDFKKLETAMEKYLSKKQTELQSSAPVQKRKPVLGEGSRRKK